MGASPFPRPAFGEAAANGLPAVFEALMVRAEGTGQVRSGHHNRNYVVEVTPDVAPLVRRRAGTHVTVRLPRPGALPVVIRTWHEEPAILDAIGDFLPHAPKCLVRGDGYAVHSFVEGVPLSSVCGNGKPVDAVLVRAVAGLLAGIAMVPRKALPPLPDEWPRDHKDGQGFLRTLARQADRQIRQPNRAGFGSLFAALGIPEDALLRLADRVPGMTRRPFSLLHADLHRDNLILSYTGDPPLICVDWELATYGDPLHDLATHLVRMRYPSYQWDEVIEAWAGAMERVRPAAVSGLGKDLRHYVTFERAQSVYPDVMRAAQALERTSDEPGPRAATAAVRSALEAASQPLRLAHVPRESEIERVLLRWRASRRSPVGEGGVAVSRVIPWQRDRRVPERVSFSEQAVQQTLLAERSEPLHTFEGTSHRSTVVRVPGSASPVVVRRRRDQVDGVAGRYLNEHAVLRAIEQTSGKVRAPVVLALGVSGLHEQFAVHTYVGPSSPEQEPRHPVDGLRPHEADDLVDQLCALTDVDWHQVDAAAGADFPLWLCEELVHLVAELPRPVAKLARQLGLPEARRLGEIVGRHRVHLRAPALLHRDLNPWNLVRGEAGDRLTIIDWERALIGDPLHDLVRHFHLTPTRPEIRNRMFRRWDLRLPPEYTRGWQEDWHVYRGLETVRSAYLDLVWMEARDKLETPGVRRAVESYPSTLAAARAWLGLPARGAANPLLAQALSPGEVRGPGRRRPVGL